MDPLIILRDSILRRAQQQHAVVMAYTDQTDVPTLTVARENIQRMEKEVNDLHKEVMVYCTTPDLVKTHSDSYDNIVKWFTVMRIKITQLSHAKVTAAVNANVNMQVKLPTMDLATFAGSYQEWNSFRDLFHAAIVQRTDLGGGQKLQYLKSCVKGEAAQLIASYQLTDANFLQAWDALKARYDNEREQVFGLLKRMTRFPALKTENATQLQRLLDTTSDAIRALRALGRPVQHWDDLLVFNLVDKLDNETRKDWSKSLQGSDVPTFDVLHKFLENHIRCLNSVNQPRQQQQQQPQERRAVHHVEQATTSSCAACSGNHWIVKCTKFLNMQCGQRYDVVKQHNLCFNCLGTGHGSRNCQSRFTCSKCKKRHHTLLHMENRRSEDLGSNQPSNEGQQQKVLLVQQPQMQATTGLLSTVSVKLMDNSGSWIICRALLDSGAECSLISEQCLKTLGLPRTKSSVDVEGISATTTKVKGEVQLQLASRVNDFQLNMTALIIMQLPKAVPSSDLPESWTHLKGLQLADPLFYKPGPVDLLLGADIVAHISLGGKVTGEPLTPTAMETELGWILTGKIAQPIRKLQVNHARCDVETLLQKFWELEELPKTNHWTKEEKEIEAHFMKHTYRNETGRFVVKLPLNEKIKNLGTSLQMVMRRFQYVENRLYRNPEHRRMYTEFMDEYEKLGHMEEVPIEATGEVIGKTNYLPHHFVLRPSSTTTKLRVVFDGSAKTSTGISFNECQRVGPTVQQDVFRQLLKIRLFPIVIKADISKMYRQFEVTKEDSDLQRIIWRPSQDQPYKQYKLRTVTYGTAAAPFLATRCITELGQQVKDTYPAASYALINDFYVDDLLSGVHSREEANTLFIQIHQALNSAGMEITKWNSNDMDFLKQIPQQLLETVTPMMDSMDDSPNKLLGIYWTSTCDAFTFQVTPAQLPAIITKRILLSEIAKIFDPLGWFAPFLITGKLLFQSLWTMASGATPHTCLQWDEPIPDELHEQWNRFYYDLPSLNNVSIPRCVLWNRTCTYELHGFSDASEKAYSAVVYLRVINHEQDNSIFCNLLCAKTKVAPVKQVSIPRLELCGAVLLAQLIATLKESTQLDCPAFCWTDSQIVLDWIKAPSKRWKTFVANRVAMIQELIPTTWRHVPSHLNPADQASRGTSATELLNSSLWWRGPEFLHQTEIPEFKLADPSEEELGQMVYTTVVARESELVTRFSSLEQIKAVLPYCLRFINNCKSKLVKQTGPITFLERNAALHRAVQLSQGYTFSVEIEKLKNGKPLTASKLLQLSPFLDKDGLLRVGGRLNASKLPAGTKHPLLIHKDSHLATLLIRSYHLKYMHANFQLLSANLRRHFWIIGGRSLVRKIVHQCPTCIRQRAACAQQLMGSLPVGRVTTGRAFQNCGVDYAGPFTLQETPGRGKKQFKAYFCIFVCFATKALHLEAVTDMTTEAFMATLKRFVARRGLPLNIFSDSGTNFVGADNALKDFVASSEFNKQVEAKMGLRGVQWHFNPPYAPHQGGLWEAGVKSVKHHLHRVVGTQTLTLEEFMTLLCQVEACLNSRPLCALSPDAMDFDALTPGHFLTNGPPAELPEPDLTDTKAYRLSRWQLQTQMLQHFWKRWSLEYLTTLQQRNKWNKEHDNLAIGQLVILRDAGLPPAKWKLGRITAIHPGADNLVRVIEITTPTGDYKRAVTQIVLLDIAGN